MAVILPNIKLQALDLLYALLNTRHPSLLRFSRLCIEPILSLLVITFKNDSTSTTVGMTNSNNNNSKNGGNKNGNGNSSSNNKNSQLQQRIVNTKTTSKEYSRLTIKIFEIFILLTTIFPSYFTKSDNNNNNSTISGLNVILDIFQQEIEFLVQSEVTLTISNTSNNSSSNSNDNSNGNGSHNNEVYRSNQYYILLFQMVETLLLFCGSNLPPIIRQNIESTLFQALFCINKGILPYANNQTLNRYIKRSLCEKLRGSLFLINLIIKLCCTEILISNKDGIMSNNITLLRNICTICLQYIETSYEASKTLATIDALIFPTMITLPSQHSILMKQTLNSHTITFPNGTSAYHDDDNINMNSQNNNNNNNSSNSNTMSTANSAIGEDKNKNSNSNNAAGVEVSSATNTLANTTTSISTATPTTAKRTPKGKQDKIEDIQVDKISIITQGETSQNKVHYFQVTKNTKGEDDDKNKTGASSSTSNTTSSRSNKRKLETKNSNDDDDNDDDDLDIPDIHIV